MNSAKQRRPRSFKVIEVDTNGKLVHDFLLVINTNLRPISHRFQDIADYWSNLRLRQGVPVFNTLVWGRTPKLRTTKFNSQETRKISLSYGIDISADDYFVLSQSTRLTDERKEKVDSKSAP